MAKELKTSLFTIYDEQGTETLIPAMKGEDGKSAYKIAVDNGFQGDEKAWLESLKGKDGTSGITTIDIERRSDGSFWTDPLTTGKVIIDMVNANKEVRLHFFDTITNTGDQLYSYETTINGVPYFRRNVVGIDKVERINIGVQYNGEIKFTQIPFRDNFLVVRTTETLNGETLKTITKSNAIKYGTVGQRTSWDNTNIKESDFAKMRVGGTILLEVLISGDSENAPAYIECIIRELTTTSCVAEGVALHMGKPVDLAELAIEVENKADRSIYLLDNSTVLQSDARDILTYADQYSGLIEFVSTSESKVAAVGYILSNLDGTCLITVTPDGTTTQWSKDGFAKHQIESYNLTNEMVDIDNLTVDVVGNPPVLNTVRNAMNKPGGTGEGSVFTLPYAINKQIQYYIDMPTGQTWYRIVNGTDGQHSFETWTPTNSLGLSNTQVGKIPKIAEVDVNGKPTKWEAVDMVDTGIPVQVMSEPTAEIKPGIFYQWPEMASLTVTLAAGKEGEVSLYAFGFISGEKPTTLSVPESVKWDGELKVEAGKKYEVSIRDGIGVIIGV